MATHHYGQIVLVSGVLDPQGRNPKDRPCVVVEEPIPEEEIPLYLVVGITTTLPGVLTADHIPIPWHRSRHPVTGLDKRNAALCSRILLVEESRILRRIGETPPRKLLEIAEALNRLSGVGHAST